MELPTPNENHEALSAFVGTWEGDEILYPSPFSPEERTATGRFVYRMGLDGFFLVSDYEESQEGDVTYRGHGIYGYDAQTDAYTMHWFDSMGGSYQKPAVGDFDGKTMQYRNVTPQGHARYTHTLDGDEYHFKIEVSEEGETWTAFMSGAYRRA